MSKDFIVKLNESSERAAYWIKVFGTLEVPVMSPAPVMASTPRGVEPNYFLDLPALEDEVRERLIDHLAEQFRIPRAEVATLLSAHGVPIPQADCSLLILNPQKWID